MFDTYVCGGETASHTFIPGDGIQLQNNRYKYIVARDNDMIVLSDHFIFDTTTEATGVPHANKFCAFTSFSLRYRDSAGTNNIT